VTSPLLDTNIVLRHLLQDDPGQSPRATRIFRDIEAGVMRVRMTDLVMFETIFTLQRRQRVPREAIRNQLTTLLDLEGIVLPGKTRWREVLDVYVTSGLSLADSYHLVMMKRFGTAEIISFDTDFDAIPNITRIEP